jgi:hypothetical protein
MGEPFDELIALLRAEGHAELADRLDDMIRHTAWTTGSELNGELGLALRGFRRTARGLSPALRQQLRTCLRAVRPRW